MTHLSNIRYCPWSALAVALVFLLTASTGAGERYALVVGLNDYPNFSARMQLRGCENDARLVRSELVGRHGFRTENVRLVLSDQGTRAGILAGWDWLASVSKPGDVCVFYYSGHGSQLKDDNGDESGEDGLDEVLCPTDFKLLDDGRGVNAIRDDELNLRARALTGRSLVAILDCCHSGTGLKALTRAAQGKYLYYEGPIPADGAARRSLFESANGGQPENSLRALGRGTERMTGFRDLDGTATSGARVALIAASRSDELAAESEPVLVGGEQRIYGCMTLELMKALRGAADGNGDGQVTFGELKQTLERPLTTPRGVQHPQVELDPAMERMIVFEGPGTAAAPGPWGNAPPLPDLETRPPVANGMQVLRVAFSVESDHVTAGVDFDRNGAIRLLDRTRSTVTAAAQAFQAVGPGEPFQAMVIASARRVGADVEYGVAVADGSANLRLRRTGMDAGALAEEAVGELRRLHLVRNVTRLRPPANSSYRVELSMVGGERRMSRGELVQFSAQGNRDGYLTVVNVDAGGGLTLLYPNRWSGFPQSWWVRAGQRIDLPSDNMGFDFAIVEPFGQEFVAAFLTPQPLDLDELGLNAAENFPSGPVAPTTTRGLIWGLTRAVGREPSPMSQFDSRSSLLAANDWAMDSLTFTTYR